MCWDLLESWKVGIFSKNVFKIHPTTNTPVGKFTTAHSPCPHVSWSDTLANTCEYMVEVIVEVPCIYTCTSTLCKWIVNMIWVRSTMKVEEIHLSQNRSFRVRSTYVYYPYRLTGWHLKPKRKWIFFFFFLIYVM